MQKTTAFLSLFVCSCVMFSFLYGETGENGTAVLDTRGLWRCHLVPASELVIRENGEVVNAVQVVPPHSLRHVPKEKRFGNFKVIEGPQFSLIPSADWMAPSFDDSRWPAVYGPVAYMDMYRSIAVLCIRGTFKTAESGNNMTLSVAFHGGALVYINGKELTRAYLPDGTLGPDTPAEPYPKEAFLDPEGKTLSIKKRRRSRGEYFPDRFEKRIRRIKDITVPSAMLRKGVNTIAIEIHRSVAPEEMFTKGRMMWSYRNSYWWSRAALIEVRLSSSSGKGIVPNIGRPRSVQVWTHPVVQRVRATDYGVPSEDISCIKIIGVRNGKFSGKAVIGSAAPILNLKAEAGDLKGNGGCVIPARAVAVRYGILDGHWRGLTRLSGNPAYFDGLEEEAPSEVPVNTGSKAAVQPVWFTVDIPADTKPGDYSGTVTLSADTIDPVNIPVELKIVSWTLPDPTSFTTHVGIIQSPESVAMKYDVPMWSEKHFGLIEKSFRLLSGVGNKVVYLPLICRTHFGNPESMVRWISKGNDTYTHDFSIPDRYLETAVKHLGTIPVVCLYCWDQYTGGFGWEGRGRGGKAGNSGVLYTVKDPNTGTLKEVEGPKWGTPEARLFWKPVLTGMKDILKKHGVEDSLMLGLAGDIGPTKECMADLESAIPDARWVAHSHQYRVIKHGNVAYLSFILTQGVYDPEDTGFWKSWPSGRRYGWRNPKLITSFPRVGCGSTGGSWEHWSSSPPSVFRAGVEGFLMACGGHGRTPTGLRGFGRLGADFWDVMKDKRGRNQGCICARYPESNWGQLNVAYGVRYLLAPGKNGPVSTVRLEMMREGLQEAEARIFLETILLDKTKRAALGEGLAGEVQALLDTRQRDFRRFIYQDQWRGGADRLYYLCLDWQKKSEALYTMAAKAEKKLNESR